MPLSRTLTATAEGPEPFELLHRLEMLRSLDDTTLEAVMEGVEPVRLLYRLPRAVLDALSDRKSGILEPLVYIVRSGMGRAQLAEVLPRFLGPLGPQELDALEQQVQSVTVRRGEALFRQGDPRTAGTLS